MKQLHFIQEARTGLQSYMAIGLQKTIAKRMACLQSTEYFSITNLRGETFVTRKITLAAARIRKGSLDKLYLGNLDAKRDWGYAKDYVECIWLMLQHDKPEDFVIATGEMQSVREFATLAFFEAGIDLKWKGKGVEEKGVCSKTGRVYVEIDQKYFRPAEVEQLCGNPDKARKVLGWNPSKTSFDELVRLMVRSDIDLVEEERSRRRKK